MNNAIDAIKALAFVSLGIIMFTGAIAIGYIIVPVVGLFFIVAVVYTIISEDRKTKQQEEDDNFI